MKIIITTPGNFSKSDKSTLIKKGICVIEAKNPEDVKVIGEATFGDADQLLLSAMEALKQSYSPTTQAVFFDSLYERIKKQQQPPAIINKTKNHTVNESTKETEKKLTLKEKIPSY